MTTAAVSYTFVANTAAKASEVNTNFNDLVTFINTQVVHTHDMAALAAIGVVLPFAGSAAPTGYLFCYGQAISRTTYSGLFGVIGTAYGNGDGSTTFNVPDLRGRVAVGMDNMGGVDAGRLDIANTLGTTGGVQKHTLSVAEMPSHEHGPSGGFTLVYASFSGDAYTPGSAGFASGANMTAAGGGGAHQNMQPYITMNYIIKT